MKKQVWGKNTSLSLENFPIGVEKMPKPLIRSLLEVKKACAIANGKKEMISKEIAESISKVVDDLLADDFMEYFPLSVWQTGSGTQTNMNANEVIAHFAGPEVHPNDHVNKGQSTNDVFPTSMQVMAVLMIRDHLLPNLRHLAHSFEVLIKEQGDIIKTGRTHYQDATPLSFGQEISAWLRMVEKNIDELEHSLEILSYLPIGGTAVGTGLNSAEGFDELVCEALTKQLDFPFQVEKNKFFGLSTRDPMLYAHNVLSVCASNMMKIGNDIRFLASGPRTGIGELDIPANEPGSSIMPGKVNPTQIEALTMVSAHVMGNQAAMLLANSQGHLELNVYLPMMAYNFWQSSRLLGDAILSFTDRCVIGIQANEEKMRYNLENSLMTATYLTRYFGYDQTTEIVNEAHEKNQSIGEVICNRGLMTEDEFKAKFNYEVMIHPDSKKEEIKK